MVVRAEDLAGNRIRVRRAGLETQALLHELDHLAGRRYVDLVPADEMVNVRPTRDRAERDPARAYGALLADGAGGAAGDAPGEELAGRPGDGMTSF